jgi:hypothetical protein
VTGNIATFFKIILRFLFASVNSRNLQNAKECNRSLSLLFLWPFWLSYTQLAKLSPSLRHDGPPPRSNVSRAAAPTAYDEPSLQNRTARPPRFDAPPKPPSPFPPPPECSDRVSDLANKLNSLNDAFQSAPTDIQQFITMLRGMQHTVNRTVDADQRARKSQALNLLLGMFERVLEERHVVDQDHSNRMEMDRLKERVIQLEEDNERLHSFCRQRDEELMRLHQDLHNAINENESLQNELSRSRDECHQEKQRAAEAELIASESEIVRDGLFSSYGALTEANVELERDLEEANLTLTYSSSSL